MALHYSHSTSGSGPPSPSLEIRPRRLFPSSSSSSSSSSRAPAGISLPPTRASSNPFSSYLNFSPSHHPQSSSPSHQSTSYRRRRSSSSSREGGGRGIALLSPFGGRGGSGGGGGERGGSSSGGGHSGWAFPESSIREEAMEEESTSPSRSRGIYTLEVLGGNWEAETQEIDMDEAQPSPSDSRRSYSTSPSSYHSSTATNRLFSTSNQTTTNPFLYGLPPSPTSSSSASRNNSGSSPTRTLSYPHSFISRRSTFLQSRAPTQSTLPNDSPAFSDASLPLEHDLMPSSPPASLQQLEVPLSTANEAGSSSRPTSFGQGGGGGALGGPASGDALGLQMHEETTDLGGLELVKRKRGMVRRLEMEWREKWDGEVVEEDEVDEGVGGRDALGLELGKRKFDELDDDEDESSPASPRSSSSPATPEDRPRHLPVIKLVVRRVAVQQQEEDEELEPSTDSEDDKEETDPSFAGNGSEWSPSSHQRASRSKGKTSMRLLQDRRSPSPVEGSPESSSSPSSSKRKRKSTSPSSEYPQTRRRTASSPLSSASPEKTMPSVPALPLDRNRFSSSTSSSALSSLEPTPLFSTKQLPASAYSSLAAASSYPQPGSQNIDDDDDGGEEDPTEPYGPPSPAPSSPLSSAPPSPQPNTNLALPPVPAAGPQPPQRRRSSVRGNNAVASSRRTFKHNLKIEPGFDGWYRNFSIPTPLSFQVTSALGLPAQDASAPPRPMAASAKRNDGGRGPMDLYSPRWVQGMGTEKTALCPICFEDDGVTPVSFKTKCSAYNYHLLHVHGISPSTGLPFSPPMDFRSVRRPAARPDERKKIRQGKCHECKCWIPVEGVKNIDVLVPEIFYWKHARDCHKSRLANDRDIWKPSATLDRITTWIDGLGDEEKSGWVVPSEHRTPAVAAPAAAV